MQDARWTKALKYMLTDLKWCMSWMIARQDGFGPYDSQPAEPNRESMSSAASSLHHIPAGRP